MVHNIAIEVYPTTVEMSHEDLQLIIAAALLHDDEFFKLLIEKLDEAKDRHEYAQG